MLDRGPEVKGGRGIIADSANATVDKVEITHRPYEGAGAADTADAETSGEI